jgi:hypothetical protein
MGTSKRQATSARQIPLSSANCVLGDQQFGHFTSNLSRLDDDPDWIMTRRETLCAVRDDDLSSIRHIAVSPPSGHTSLPPFQLADGKAGHLSQNAAAATATQSSNGNGLNSSTPDSVMR